MNFEPARLVVRYGALPNQEYPLDGRPITMIGREPINDIALNDPEISRRHARIDYANGRFTLEDLGSTNGTYLNGRRLSEAAALKNGDVIEFGESISFVFQTGLAADHTLADAQHYMPEYAATAVDYQLPTSKGAAPSTHPLQQSVGGGPPPVVLPPVNADRRFSTPTILAGCGCLLLLIVVLCAGSLYLLDSLNPNLLYCNWLGFIFEGTTMCQ